MTQSRDFLTLQRRAGLITETAYQQRLQEADALDDFAAEFEDLAKDVADAIADEIPKQEGVVQEDLALLPALATAMTANSVVNLIAKGAKLLFTKLGATTAAEVADKVEHATHTVEKGIKQAIKTVLQQQTGIQDENSLTLAANTIYGLIITEMAIGYGTDAVEAIANSNWFKAPLAAIKAAAKTAEFPEIYKSIDKLI